MILGQYFLGKNYFLYLKVYLLVIFRLQNKLCFFKLFARSSIIQTYCFCYSPLETFKFPKYVNCGELN